MNEESDVLHLAVTGTYWMGGGIGSLETAIDNVLDETHQELIVAAYRISEYVPQFFERLLNILKRGGKVTMILNRLDEHPTDVISNLRGLLMHNGFSLFKYVPKDQYDDLHAKILVSDRTRAIIGSANLSWRGLVTNHEIGTVITGPTAGEIGRLLDLLIAKHPQVVRVSR
jgi:cardiolipin synthase